MQIKELKRQAIPGSDLRQEKEAATMRILSIHIKNFKSIRSMEIDGIQQALILVGKNNTGKEQT